MTSDYGGLIQLWDASTAGEAAQFDEHARRAWSVDFSTADPMRFLRCARAALGAAPLLGAGLWACRVLPCAGAPAGCQPAAPPACAGLGSPCPCKASPCTASLPTHPLLLTPPAQRLRRRLGAAVERARAGQRGAHPGPRQRLLRPVLARRLPHHRLWLRQLPRLPVRPARARAAAGGGERAAARGVVRQVPGRAPPGHCLHRLGAQVRARACAWTGCRVGALGNTAVPACLPACR